MNLRTRIIVAITLVLALVTIAGAGVTVKNEADAEAARIAAEHQQRGEAAALKIDGELTAIAVAMEAASRDIGGGEDPVRVLDRLMASMPLLRVTGPDGTTRPPTATALTAGVDGYHYDEGHYWQTTEGTTLVAQIRDDVIEQHVWDAHRPGDEPCTLYGSGQHFPTARGPTITCPADGAVDHSILVGSGLTAGAVFVAGAGVAAVVSVRLTRPVQSIRLAVQEIEQGNLEARADATGPLDMRSLASDVNSMAEQLAEERAELEAFNDRLQEMVAARTKQLEKAKETQAQFFYGLGHDLKAPLRGVSGFAGLLDRALDRGDYERAAVHVEQVRRSGKTMTDLVTQLLDFGSAEHETPKPRRIDMRSLLTQVSVEASSMGDVEIDAQSRFQFAELDASMVERIVRNLVSNAIHHGGGHIRVRAKRVHGSVQIVVRDNGSGIPEALLPDLFQPFVRGGNIGSGLGLAIVERLATAHGGTVQARNNGGAVVTVTLSETPATAAGLETSPG